MTWHAIGSATCGGPVSENPDSLAEQDVLLLSGFADAMAGLERGRVVSLGRYALRGVERPQDLYTLDPFWSGRVMPA